MKKIITIAISLLGVAAASLAFYQFGLSNCPEKDTVIKVEASIENIISSIPEGGNDEVKGLLGSILEIVEESTKKEDQINRGAIHLSEEKIIKHLKDISLVTYKASQSPFVPPLNKVQLLCEGNFSLSYSGEISTGSKIKVNDDFIYALKPGDIRKYKKDNNELIITVMNFDDKRNGPVLKYECVNL